MKVIGKDRTSCDVCNPIDEILARLDALERRASAIVAKVQGLAPDGEGNVTLPTSSSDTDPLHGRIDAFAMSSEVKEAADDAHAYAASIADDVIVINSEIDALNQAVAALQPAEIEAIKAAVQTLQTTVATLETAVDALNNAVVKKVSKSGDTMTGSLTTPRVDIKSNLMSASEIPTMDQFLDNSSVDRYGAAMVLDRLFRGSNGDIIKQLGIIDRTGGYHWINLLAVSDGGDYATAPSWSPGTNDNSDKIITIKMANSLPSLVHTTGNETIAGDKTFNGKHVIKRTNPWIHFVNDDFTKGTIPSISNNWDFRFSDANETVMGRIRMEQATDGNARMRMNLDNYDGSTTCYLELVTSLNNAPYISIPTTPTGATGNSIATANWVLARINELATKNGLKGL